MFEVKSIVRPERVAAVVDAIHRVPDAPGITISVIRSIGKPPHSQSAPNPEFGETEMAKLEAVVPETMVHSIVAAVQSAGSTGRAGDGKISVSRVDQSFLVHSGPGRVAAR